MIERTAVELLELLHKGDLTAEALTTQFLDAIRQREPKIKAFLHLNEAQSLEQAKAIDAKRRQGQSLGPLAGLPVAVKDVLCTQGMRTTCGSKILATFVPPYDAHVVTKLKAADAIFIGKTNL